MRHPATLPDLDGYPVSAETLRHAHAVHRVAAVQIEYSLFTRFVEDEMLATCRELARGVQ